MQFLNNIFIWMKSYKNDIGINLIAGMLASIIVLTLQIFVKSISIMLVSFFELKWKLRILWQINKPKRLYIVSGAIEGVSEYVKSVVLAGADAEAANTLIGTTGLLFPETEIRHVYSSYFVKEFYKEHLIIVGGPINNSCTAAAFEFLMEDISFSKDFEMVVDGLKFETIYDKKNNPIKDYGAVIRTNNPFDSTKDILLVVGCDTYGVLAAAMLISSMPDAKLARKLLYKKLGLKRYFFKQNFIAIVGCNVLGNNIGDISLRYFKKLKIEKNERVK